MNRQLPAARPMALYPGAQNQPAPQLPAIRTASPWGWFVGMVVMELFVCPLMYVMLYVGRGRNTSEESAAIQTAIGIGINLLFVAGVIVFAFVRTAKAAEQLRGGRLYAGTISAMQALLYSSGVRVNGSPISAWNLQVTFFLPERGVSELRSLTVNSPVGSLLNEGVAVVIVVNQTTTSLAAYRSPTGWCAISPFALGKG